MTKGRQAGRMIVNEHVVARLGREIQAPTPEVVFVDVPQPLIDAEPEMAHMAAGRAHGARFLPSCTERENLLHAEVPENRPRFAALAVLYGWVQAGDHQFIYENSSPHRVHSVDHGHFFPNGPDWTEQSLSAAPDPQPDPTLVGPCSLTDSELEEALHRLQQVPDASIEEIVHGPPDDWQLQPSERQSLLQYLRSRREHLIRGLGGQDSA